MRQNKTPLLVAEALQIQRGTGSQAKRVLNGHFNCAFTLQSGRLYHLLGPSGCGKTTLLWTLARLHPLNRGTLRLNGIPHSEIAVTGWRAEIALLPQQPVMIPSTVTNNLLYPLYTFQRQQERLKKRGQSLPNTYQLQQELQSVGLDEIPLERAANSLSGGQQARLALLRVLLTQPQIILADEPLASIDKTAAQQVLERLDQFCQAGGTIIMTGHELSNCLNKAQILLDGQGSLRSQEPVVP